MATRRTFLQLATAWWSAAALQAQQQPATFLNATELETLRRLTNILIPADERSGGANAAKVELYIDSVLAHANPALFVQRTVPAEVIFAFKSRAFEHFSGDILIEVGGGKFPYLFFESLLFW